MRRLPAYCPAILTALLILYLSLIREPRLTLPPFTGADKIAHCGMYLLLAGLFTFGRLANHAKGWTCTWLVILLCSLYGGGIELLQAYCFPPRTGDWADWLADAAGAVSGTYLMTRLWNYHKN